MQCRIEGTMSLALVFGCRQSGQAFRAPAGSRVTFLLAAQKGDPKMRPGPVARTMKLCGCASTGRVRLKAHPVPQPKPRDPPRGPQAADPSSTCRQERASTSRAQRSCAVLLLIYLPFRGGEVDSERPVGWPERIRASSLPAQECAVSEPRRQLAPSCGFIARPTRLGRIFGPRFCASRKVARRAAARRNA